MSENYRVPKRYLHGTFQIIKYERSEDRALPLLREFHKPLTPMLKSVAHALFALTDNQQPDGWQQAKPADLIALVYGDDTSDVSQRQRLDVYAALRELRRRAIPLAHITIVRRGRYYAQEVHLREVSLLQGVGLVYRSRKTGELLRPQEDRRLRDVRRPMALKGFDHHEQDAPTGRRRRGPQDDDDPLHLYGLPRGGDFVGPVAFEFRWGSDILEDLQMLPAHDSAGRVLKGRDGEVIRQGIGFIRLQRDTFAILKRLRDAGQQTAAMLFELVAGDLLGEGPTGQILEKEAKLIFQLLGFPEPGSRRGLNRRLQDGRWTENVERLANAVRALKAEGVLEAESDEEPRIDPNPNRRKAAYYRWKRSSTFTPSFRILDAEEADALGGVPPKPAIAAPTPKPPSEPEPTTPDLFGRTPTVAPLGREVRAAREAAGLDLRAFADRFGWSIKFWSDVENEVLSRRTGEPKAIPADVLDAVVAFVNDHHPDRRKDGTPE